MKQEQKKNLFFSAGAGAVGAAIVLLTASAGFASLPAEQRLQALRSIVGSDSAGAADTRIPQDTGMLSEESGKSVTDVVKTVSPSVVSIVVTQEVPTYENVYNNDEYYDPFEEFFGAPSPFGDLFRRRTPERKETGTEKVEIGGGTGFLISEDGYIVTNRHVVSQTDVEYRVVMDDESEHPATVVAADPIYDIAVIKIEGNGFPFLTFGDSETIEVGQTAIAIGNALAEFRNTVSVGVISGLARSITAGDGFGSYEKLDGVIQTDAAINPGNSGGPLLNLKGEVIGMNVAMAGAENIGFALPSNMVRDVADGVREHGNVQRAFLGIRYIPITPNLKERNNLPIDYGALVIRGENTGDLAVTPGSAADKAGIVENDIIMEIDGERIDEDHPLASIIRTKNVGDTVELKVYHKGDEITLRATLEAYPE